MSVRRFKIVFVTSLMALCYAADFDSTWKRVLSLDLQILHDSNSSLIHVRTNMKLLILSIFFIRITHIQREMLKEEL